MSIAKVIRHLTVFAAKAETPEDAIKSIRWYIRDLRGIAGSRDYDEIEFISTRIQDYWRDTIRGGKAPKKPGAKSNSATLLRYCDAMTALVDAKEKELVTHTAASARDLEIKVSDDLYNILQMIRHGLRSKTVFGNLNKWEPANEAETRLKAKYSELAIALEKISDTELY